MFLQKNMRNKEKHGSHSLPLSLCLSISLPFLLKAPDLSSDTLLLPILAGSRPLSSLWQTHMRSHFSALKQPGTHSQHTLELLQEDLKTLHITSVSLNKLEFCPLVIKFHKYFCLLLPDGNTWCEYVLHYKKERAFHSRLWRSQKRRYSQALLSMCDLHSHNSETLTWLCVSIDSWIQVSLTGNWSREWLR